MNNLTASQKSRVFQAIADCERFIDKEARRDSALRPADMQKHLDYCVAHKAKLIEMVGSAA